MSNPNDRKKLLVNTPYTDLSDTNYKVVIGHNKKICMYIYADRQPEVCVSDIVLHNSKVHLCWIKDG
jgi:hypothetical protein